MWLSDLTWGERKCHQPPSSLPHSFKSFCFASSVRLIDQHNHLMLCVYSNTWSDLPAKPIPIWGSAKFIFYKVGFCYSRLMWFFDELRLRNRNRNKKEWINAVEKKGIILMIWRTEIRRLLKTFLSECVLRNLNLW